MAAVATLALSKLLSYRMDNPYNPALNDGESRGCSEMTLQFLILNECSKLGEGNYVRDRRQ
jgi:hypothetical protein